MKDIYDLEKVQTEFEFDKLMEIAKDLFPKEVTVKKGLIIQGGEAVTPNDVYWQFDNAISDVKKALPDSERKDFLDILLSLTWIIFGAWHKKIKSNTTETMWTVSLSDLDVDKIRARFFEEIEQDNGHYREIIRKHNKY